MRFLCFCWIICSGVLHAQRTDTAFVRLHLQRLTKTKVSRNYQQLKQLNESAQYIYDEFAKSTDSLSFQEYKVEGRVYKNVVCSFGTEHKKRIVVGAHYDVCGNQQGADDNASGVVGLLELARLLHDRKLNYRIDLVAYTLEEPPYYDSEWMGSYVHAAWLRQQKAELVGMISLEMIGFFSDERKSQGYPLGILSWIYGNKGNYITLVKKFGSGRFARQFCRKYKRNGSIRTKKFTGPKALPGIDFSDHRNYWHFGFSALMITDTAFYRNKNYHEKTDTMEKLDLPRMALVIDGVYQTLVGF